MDIKLFKQSANVGDKISFCYGKKDLIGTVLKITPGYFQVRLENKSTKTYKYNTISDLDIITPYNNQKDDTFNRNDWLLYTFDGIM